MINKKIFKISCLLSVLLLQTQSYAMNRLNPNEKPFIPKTVGSGQVTNVPLADNNPFPVPYSTMMYYGSTPVHFRNFWQPRNDVPSTNENSGTKLNFNLNATSYLSKNQKKEIIDKVVKQFKEHLNGEPNQKVFSYSLYEADFETYEDMKKFIAEMVQEILKSQNYSLDLGRVLKKYDGSDRGSLENEVRMMVNSIVKDYGELNKSEEIWSCKNSEELKYKLNNPTNQYNCNQDEIFCWEKFNTSPLDNTYELKKVTNTRFKYGFRRYVFGAKANKLLSDSEILFGMRLVVAFTEDNEMKFYLFPDHYRSTAIELVCHEK